MKNLDSGTINPSFTVDIMINFDETFQTNKIDFELQNLLKHHRIFESELLIPVTSIQPESELIIISVLKDKVYQLYKKHITFSNVINNTNESFRNKSFYDLSIDDVEAYKIWISFMETISDFTRWLTRFAKELPGFNNMNIEDFSTMVFAAVFPLYTVQVTPFVVNDENFTVISNNLRFTKKRMILASEKVITNLLFEFHMRFQSLNLTEQELCLFYPFLLTSCNGKLIGFYDFIEINILAMIFFLNSKQDK